METITPDYLVVGAGAMGLAFVDTVCLLLSYILNKRDNHSRDSRFSE